MEGLRIEKPEKAAAVAAGDGKKEAENGKQAWTGKQYGEALKRQVVEQIEAGKLTVRQAQWAVPLL